MTLAYLELTNQAATILGYSIAGIVGVFCIWWGCMFIFGK